MRLTLWTDYALRILIYVGANRARVSTIGEIAESFLVSRAHLMKIVNQLARLGYLETTRGRGGGIRLALAPEAIRIGGVVRSTEDNLALIPCLPDGGFCRIEGCCVLRQALRDATAVFLRTLDGYTLADLLAPRARLAASLSLGERRSAAGA